MKLQFIFEKELEKINLIFALMNQISDPKMMKRYEFISNLTNYSVETIRKILNGTRTYMYYKKGKYSFKFFITIQIFGIQIGNFTFQKRLNI